MSHVIVKGCHDQWIVRDERDEQMLLSLFAEACRKFGWEILTYCLLGNHMHLLIYTPDGNLSEGMQWTCWKYALYFRARQEHKGPVLKRFKAYSVHDEAYLVAVIRYIAFNPVRHGIVDDPLAWRTSAHAELLGVRPSGPIDVSALHDFLEQPGRYARLFENLDEGAANPSERAILVDARRGFTVSQIIERRRVSESLVRRTMSKHAIPIVTPRTQGRRRQSGVHDPGS